MIRLLIVDDEWMVRAMLRTIMATYDDIEVVGEADDGDRAVDSLREGQEEATGKSEQADLVLARQRHHTAPGPDDWASDRAVASRGCVLAGQCGTDRRGTEDGADTRRPAQQPPPVTTVVRHR